MKLIGKVRGVAVSWVNKMVMSVKHMGTHFTLITDLQDCVIIQIPDEG